MTNEQKTDHLLMLMSLASAECDDALRELERAMFSVKFYRTTSWERRLQKISSRVRRADSRLRVAKYVVNEHHDETCEKCRWNVVAAAIVQDYEQFGATPLEERN